MARRAASICRAVSRPRPTAFSPYSPKLTLAPRVATPVLRPFCSLRYFLLAGCSMFDSRSSSFLFRFGRHRHRSLALAQDHALEHQDAHADHTVSGLRFGKTNVNIGTQCMQWHAPFAVPLGAGDLNTVQPPCAGDLNTLRTQSHGVSHRAFHRTAEHDAFFELLGDRIGNDLRVDFRLTNFFDVHMNWNAHQFGQCGAQGFNILTFLTDHHAWAGAVNCDFGILGRTLDDDATHRRV